MTTGTLPLVASDEQLLTAAGHGDGAALEELFRRHRLLAYRVAYRLLGHEADALDAVQEAFVKALTHLPTFQGRSSFKTWLLRVVRNAAFDLGRQRGRRELLSISAPHPTARDEREPWVLEEPGRGLEREDLRRQLRGALARLPAAQRETFILHAEGELSYREVADVLGISIGTVMSRLYYARQKLRALLETCVSAP